MSDIKHASARRGQIIECEAIPEKLREKLRRDEAENLRLRDEAARRGDWEQSRFFFGRACADKRLRAGDDPAWQKQILFQHGWRFMPSYVKGFLEVCEYFEGIV